MKKKPKAKTIILRFRKNDPAHNLQAAAQHWLRANGGDAIVMGGIGILDEGAHKFQICVGIVGRKPVKENKK